jgi:hypothetical protein
VLKIGHMLYFSEKKSLEEKLRLVISYYNRKVGKNPEFVVISRQEDFSDEKFGEVDIYKRQWINKNYFWVGVYG